MLVGETLTLAPEPIEVPFNSQLYVPPVTAELAVSVVEPPTQIVAGVALTDGPGLTVTVVVALDVPQFGTVNVTV